VNHYAEKVTNEDKVLLSNKIDHMYNGYL